MESRLALNLQSSSCLCHPNSRSSFFLKLYIEHWHILIDVEDIIIPTSKTGLNEKSGWK